MSQAKRKVLEAALKLGMWSDLAVLRTALAECEHESTQATSGVGSTVPLQEYRDGRLVDTLATVRAAGFDGGSMVVKKGDCSSHTCEVLDAKSGFVHVKKLKDSTEIQVPVGEFLQDYELLNKQVAVHIPVGP